MGESRLEPAEEAGLLEQDGGVQVQVIQWRRPAFFISGLLLLSALVAAAREFGSSSRSPTALHGTGDSVTVGLAAQGKDEMPSVGVVHSIYTYGAPATANPPLENQLRGDGCFEGLRSYNEDVLNGITKQVDAAAISNNYPHAKMATAVLHGEGDSIYVPCPGEVGWPTDKTGNVFGEWRLHWENDYTPRLKHIQVAGVSYGEKEPFFSAYLFVILAYKSYDSTAHTKAAIAERMPGWKLVARETRIQGSGTLYDEDPVMIAQDTKTLDCAVTFTGTNNIDNELTTSTTNYATGYCGHTNVHAGYRNELWEITKDLWPKLRPKLAKCNKVYCVGHSLGGSLCEIFAACANSKRISDPDYQQQMWAQQTPEEMPEIDVGGTVMVEGAEKRCEEPPCPKVR